MWTLERLHKAPCVRSTGQVTVGHPIRRTGGKICGPGVQEGAHVWRRRRTHCIETAGMPDLWGGRQWRSSYGVRLSHKGVTNSTGELVGRRDPWGPVHRAPWREQVRKEMKWERGARVQTFSRRLS